MSFWEVESDRNASRGYTPAMRESALIVTGASGFLGRHLLDALKEEHRIFGIARRSQHVSGAPVHPNISWFQVDIANRPGLEEAYRSILGSGGARTVIHLAAHYDFTGEEHPEYWRTNVEGLRNVLNCSRAIGAREFVFSSSVAACEFPRPGESITEASPADGAHIYARTKRAGEDMLREYRGDFRSHVVRFAALFSDWCEYPPLFKFMETWLSLAWNRRILGGRGLSAVPYLHVRDAVTFLRALLERGGGLDPEQVLVASPDGATSHLELFDAVCRDGYGDRLRPRFMPKFLCGPGMRVRDVLGRLTGHRPFERPWMAEFIDLRLEVNSLRSRQLLDWAPRARLEILRRMPFLVEHLKTEPVEWNRRNHAAMKQVQVRTNLLIYHLLERHEDEIFEEFTRRLTDVEAVVRFSNYHDLAADQHRWNHRLVLRQLMNAIRTRDRAVFFAYCGDLAERRFHQGYQGQQVCDALQLLNQICFKVLRRDPEATGLRDAILDHVTSTLRAGSDHVLEVFESLERRSRRRPPSPSEPPTRDGAERT